jgi:hypothetical protein
VVEIYEVYEYKVTQYAPATGQGGLFVEYINTFLKLKAEASGYPSWVRTSEDEDSYINAFMASKGIRLDRNNVRPNAAKRALAKLCLNSMWGKLTESNHRTMTELISNPQELHKFLATPGIEVVNLLFASDHFVWNSWTYAAEGKIPNLPHTNEVIGSYVTAGARIYLYAYLDKLQERAIYTDTDSIIHIQDDAELPLIDCGDKLGSMTNELQPGEFIEEFVSGGPKSYAYRVVGGGTDTTKTHRNTLCKVRGITLKYSTSQLVNFDVIWDMILKTRRSIPGEDVVTVHTDKKIKRKREKDGRVQILSEAEDKIFRVSFFKRRRLHDNNSVPFGYINNE